MERQVGQINNYYGGLIVKQDEKGLWWGIEGCNGTSWYSIPQYLFDALMRHEDERTKTID